MSDLFMTRRSQVPRIYFVIAGFSKMIFSVQKRSFQWEFSCELNDLVAGETHRACNASEVLCFRAFVSGLFPGYFRTNIRHSHPTVRLPGAEHQALATHRNIRASLAPNFAFLTVVLCRLRRSAGCSVGLRTAAIDGWLSIQLRYGRSLVL